MCRSNFAPTGKVIIAPEKRSAWPTSNSLCHQAKVYTAKPLVGVATHLSRDESVFVLEKIARSELQVSNREH
jgi:hypothetical protein